MLKEYKNGNIHIRLEKDDTGLDVIEKLYFNYDMYPVGGEYCISNDCTACDWSYNGGSAYFRINGYQLFDLEEGKTIILQPLPWDYVEEYLLSEEY